jgi:hypothetical protein
LFEKVTKFQYFSKLFLIEWHEKHSNNVAYPCYMATTSGRENNKIIIIKFIKLKLKKKLI